MTLPEIKGFIDLSLVDWDGKVSAVIFLPGCNFRCPFCYNPILVLKPEELQTIPFGEVEQYLTTQKLWLDGVVITGGEPTLHKGLSELCGVIREQGLSIKLDTNGTSPSTIRNLIANGLVDCIAMDLKAPLTPGKYSKAVGVNMDSMLQDVEKTAEMLLAASIEYEFRTTLVPSIHRSKDVQQICQRIRGCQKYVLQNFKEDVETLDPKLKGMKGFPQEKMDEFLGSAKETISNTFLR